MENAILKAIEGGYLFKLYNGEPSCELNVYGGEGELKLPVRITATYKDGYVRNVTQHEITGDPLFWQCLGASMGWGDVPSENLCGWLYKMHRFIDHIANGGTVDDFFKDLLK